MDILIIEDEILASERLQMLIKKYDPTINIVASLETVEEAVAWLNTKPHPHLLMVDIHLADGHSFEIFKKVQTNKPIIFTTAYDKYALNAFKLFSIDYILKPITEEALAAAFNKYNNIVNNTTPADIGFLLQQVKDNYATQYKNRFLAKIGQRVFLIAVADVAYFAADNKIVHLITREGNKYIKNSTIEKLEQIIDPSIFFRVNRKIIVHADAIEQVRTYDNNRLKIILKNIDNHEEIIISRERVADFKMWIDN